MIARLGLGAVGVAMGLYGAVLVLGRPQDLVSVVVWFAGAVLLHDAVVAPLTIGATLLARRVVPAAWRTPVTLGVVVLLLVTASALPQLGRFGARPDNPTLLDRNYVAGWLVLAALVLVVTVVGGVLRQRRPAPRRA